MSLLRFIYGNKVSYINVKTKNSLMNYIGGDKANIYEDENYLYFFIFDGAGGKYRASLASKISYEIFNYMKVDNFSSEIIFNIEKSLKNENLSGVIFIGRISKKNNILEYLTLGNIAGKLISKNSFKNCYKFIDFKFSDGALGYFHNEVFLYKQKIKKNDFIVLYSDGLYLNNKNLYELAINVDNSQTKKDISLILEDIVKNYSKKNDDVSLIIIKVL